MNDWNWIVDSRSCFVVLRNVLRCLLYNSSIGVANLFWYFVKIELDIYLSSSSSSSSFSLLYLNMYTIVLSLSLFCFHVCQNEWNALASESVCIQVKEPWSLSPIQWWWTMCSSTRRPPRRQHSPTRWATSVTSLPLAQCRERAATMSRWTTSSPGRRRSFSSCWRHCGVWSRWWAWRPICTWSPWSAAVANCSRPLNTSSSICPCPICFSCLRVPRSRSSTSTVSSTTTECPPY